MSNAFKVEEVSGKAIVTFTRPEIRNPLTTWVMDELADLVMKLDRSRVRQLVFTGSGNIFAAGADLREIASLGPSDARALAEKGQHLMRTIAESPIETIAAVNGACYGGALDLALSCDRRVATPNATFCHPGAKIGLITGFGGTQRLPRLVGSVNAVRMFFTAEPIDALEALRIGLIERISDDPIQEC